MTLRLEVARIHPDAVLPSYSQPGDAGLDLCSIADVQLKPGERATIATGIKIGIPSGYAGYVQPRSGRAAKEGLGLVNSPGLIDSGYRGELKVIAINLDTHSPIHIAKGERIAQLVVLAIPAIEVALVDDLAETERGSGGFGSTGS